MSVKSADEFGAATGATWTKTDPEINEYRESGKRNTLSLTPVVALDDDAASIIVPRPEDSLSELQQFDGRAVVKDHRHAHALGW